MAGTERSHHENCGLASEEPEDFRIMQVSPDAREGPAGKREEAVLEFARLLRVRMIERPCGPWSELWCVTWWDYHG